MSGTYPWMYGGFDSLHPDRPHLAAQLAEAGYTTGGFHSNPYLGADFGYDRGFDMFYEGGDDTSSLAALRKRIVRHLDQESVPYRLLRGAYKTFETRFGRDLGTPYVPAADLTGRVSDWLATTAEPVFCWVHYMDVHHPYVPHEGTVSSDIDRSTAIQLRQRMIEAPETLTDDNVTTLHRLYAGEIEYVDRHVETLLATAERELDGETTVATLSDHGEAFGEHSRYGHTDILYDEVVQIPLGITGPGFADTTLSTPVSCVDLLPTVLATVDREPPTACEGQPIQNLLETPPTERYVFTHAEQRTDGSVMVCDGTWKLIADASGEPRELYDRATDPEERSNVLDSEPNARQRLQAALDDHLAAIDDSHTVTAAEIDEETQDRLDQLGYIE
jgi:arylsulfatase A-like enzyme